MIREGERELETVPDQCVGGPARQPQVHERGVVAGELHQFGRARAPGVLALVLALDAEQSTDRAIALAVQDAHQRIDLRVSRPCK